MIGACSICGNPTAHVTARGVCIDVSACDLYRRESRARVDKAVQLDAGDTLPHWTCPACGCFNGLAKENLKICRACGKERPAC